MKAKKFIDKKIEGEYDLIKNHVINIDITTITIEAVCFEFLGVGDDPETDMLEKGVITDEDGDIAYVEIGRFLDAVDKQNEENNNVDEYGLDSKLYDEIQKLKPYRDYVLYC